uniref:Ribosomal protein S3 n=1 Tax=Stachyamoeba lipophora TaxID=463046 RepID=A0A0B5GFW0_STALP|nr:hypothetical protein [Stachyamoeba lipophora]AJF22897.1 hypothetical protein [Stachyamoeba lipophora]
MSRLSNLTSIKIGFLKSWNSSWFDNYFYSDLLFNDLKLKDYLSGIFYKLKVVSDYIYIYRSVHDFLLFRTNLFFFYNVRYKSLRLKTVVGLNNNYYFFFKKKYWKRFIYFVKLISIFLKKNFGTFDVHNFSLFESLFSYNYYIRFSGILLSNIFLKFNSFNSKLSYNHLLEDQVLIRKFCNIDSILYVFSNHLNCIQLNSSENYLFFSWKYDFMFAKVQTNILLLIKYYYLAFCLMQSQIFSFFVPKLFLVGSTNEIVFSSLFSSSISFANISEYLTKKNIIKSLFNEFRQNIELSVQRFEGQSVYFLFSVFLKRKPYLISAKMIADTIIFLLESGQKIVKSFYFINNWHAFLFRKKRKLEYKFYSNRKQYASDFCLNLNYLFHYSLKKSPILGIRIECSGSFKKGTMSRVYHYNNWVKNNYLIGRMPHNTLTADIDYYQSFVSLNSSCIGIKAWIFLETHIYNERNNYISIVY